MNQSIRDKVKDKNHINQLNLKGLRILGTGQRRLVNKNLWRRLKGPQSQSKGIMDFKRHSRNQSQILVLFTQYSC